MPSNSIFLCSLLFFVQNIFGQDYAVEFIDYKQGLSQSCGIAVVKQNGFMWFATQDGLNRFDGTRIKVFKTKDFPGLRNNYINALAQLGSDHLLIGTIEGLSLMDTKFNTITTLASDKIGYVERIFIDDHNNIWVTSENEGLYVQWKGDLSFTKIKEMDNETVVGFTAYLNTILIVTKTGIFQYSTESQKLNKLKFLPNTLIQKAVLSTAFFDSNQNLWVGTLFSGLFKCHIQNDVCQIDSKYNQNSSKIGSDEITCISEDNECRLWVGTGSASAYTFDGARWTSINELHGNLKVIHGYTYSLFHDNQGITWVGTDGYGIAKCDRMKTKFSNILALDKRMFQSNQSALVLDIAGKGSKIYLGIKDMNLIEYDEKTSVFRKIPLNHPGKINNYPVQLMLQKDQLWIASFFDIMQYDTKKGVLSKSIYLKKASIIYTLNQTNSNNIYLGGIDGLYYLDKGNSTLNAIDFDHPLSKISKLFIRVIYEDKFKNLWIGTTGNGLYFLETTTGKLMQINEYKNFNCKSIRCFKETETEMLVGTDCGMYTLDMKGNVISIVTSDFGLPNDVIYCIEKSSLGGYWLGSNAGLTYLSHDHKRIKTYTESDGLVSNEFNTNASFVSESGLFYFGGMKGLVSFDEKTILENNYHAKLKISDIFIGNKVIPIDDWAKDSIIELAYDQKYLKIALAVSNFSDSENNYCMYKINGFSGWTKMQKNNELHLTGLSPGKYTLSMRGYNSDNYATLNEIELLLVVKAPFWKHRWFFMTMLTGIFAMIYLWLTIRWKNREKELKYKAEIDEIKNMALRSQMNPHFICNCLSAIENLISDRNSEKAQMYLNKFSRLVRNTLDFTRNEFVTLKEELAHLDLYVMLENLRFNNVIKFELNIEEGINTENLLFPPLILQPLVENSIKHGFSNKITHPKIKLHIHENQKKLIIHLRDNGIGIQHRSSEFNELVGKNYGLDLTKQRLHLYGMKIEKSISFNIFDLQANGEVGTLVEITIDL